MPMLFGVRAGWPRVFVFMFATLVVIITLVVVPARLPERRTPFGRIFTHPDGQLCNRMCLFGIVPGETTLVQALKLLGTHPLTRTLPVTKIGSDASLVVLAQSFVVGLTHDDEGHVSLIDLQLAESTMGNASATDDSEGSPRLPPSSVPRGTLAELLASIGTPDFLAFSMTNDGPTLRLYYQEDALVAIYRQLSVQRLMLDEPFMYLYLTTDSSTVYPGMVHWLGFTTVQHYTGNTLRP